jgi:cytochrome o ubiquinol oxidase operon protein cyoD
MNSIVEPQGKVPGLIGRTHGSRRSYIFGLVLASTLTVGSFWAASTEQIYRPGIPLLLGVLAIAQIGIHLVFFLNISSAPDQTNNFLSLAFGVFVVGLIVFGSMLIMAQLNHMAVPMDALQKMQR